MRVNWDQARHKITFLGLILNIHVQANYNYVLLWGFFRKFLNATNESITAYFCIWGHNSYIYIAHISMQTMFKVHNVGGVIKPCISKILSVQESQKHDCLNTIMNGTAFFLPSHSGAIFSDWNLQFGQDKI